MSKICEMHKAVFQPHFNFIINVNSKEAQTTQNIWNFIVVRVASHKNYDKLWWSSGRVQILTWRLGDTVLNLESPRWSRRVDRKCKEHYKSWSQEPKGSCFTASDKLSSSTEFTPQCCFHLVIKQSTFLLRYQETLFKNVIMGLITNSCYLKWKSHLIKVAFQLSGFGYETPVIVIKSLKFDLNFY